MFVVFIWCFLQKRRQRQSSQDYTKQDELQCIPAPTNIPHHSGAYPSVERDSDILSLISRASQPSPPPSFYSGSYVAPVGDMKLPIPDDEQNGYGVSGWDPSQPIPLSGKEKSLPLAFDIYDDPPVTYEAPPPLYPIRPDSTLAIIHPKERASSLSAYTKRSTRLLRPSLLGKSSTPLSSKLVVENGGGRESNERVGQWKLSLREVHRRLGDAERMLMQ